MNEQTALAFILFAMFYNSCLAATMVFRREAGGGGYVSWLFIFTFVVAYICAFGEILVYKFLLSFFCVASVGCFASALC
ncbi:MAG: hypothetical protein MR582_07900 [Campylobacter sp.]|nr:hypothetical protein [Campylobacter sp.]